MANLAIKGHSTRGKEVIDILEMLGGKQFESYNGNDINWCYTIIDGSIDWDYPSDKYKVFSLEEFLEKYPYKVGDKVGIPEYESEVPILSMNWNGYEVQYEVFTDETEWYSAEELNKYNEPHKEETMEERPLNAETYFKIFDNKTGEGYEVFVNDEYELKQIDGHFYINKKKPQYPETYGECCDVLGCDRNFVLGTMPMKYKVLIKFQQLLICRDAYWKIAGEKMGLGKPWEPDWGSANSKKSILYTCENKIHTGISLINNHILAFPTEEMRDAFYENFKNWIEECKELL